MSLKSDRSSSIASAICEYHGRSLRCHVNAAEVRITVPVAEPPSHLHQAVIHDRVPKKISRHQALEREAAGKAKAADGDQAPTVRVVFPAVVENAPSPSY